MRRAESAHSPDPPGVGAISESTNRNALAPITHPIRNGFMFGIGLVADFGVPSGLARLPGDEISDL